MISHVVELTCDDLSRCDESLRLCSRLDTIETMIVSIKRDNFESSLPVFYGKFRNLSYLVVCVYVDCFGLSSMLKDLMRRMTSLRGLHVFQEASQSYSVNVFDLAHCFAPYIEDLQQIYIGKTGLGCHDHIQYAHDMIKGDMTFSKLKMLKHISENFGDIIHRFSKVFPDLEHLSFHAPLTLSCKQLRACSAILSVKSLCVHQEMYSARTIQQNYHFWRRMTAMIALFPNLCALDFSPVVKFLSVLRSEVSQVIRVCPTLVILNISSAYELTTDCTLVIVRKLKHLRVLVLPAFKEMRTELNYSVLYGAFQCSTQLTSLIGTPHSADLVDKLPTLKYISDPKYPDQIAKLERKQPTISGDNPKQAIKRGPAEEWITVEKFSPDWYEAYGAHYFHTNSSSSHLKRTEQHSMIPRMLPILRECKAIIRQENERVKSQYDYHFGSNDGGGIGLNSSMRSVYLWESGWDERNGRFLYEHEYDDY